VLENPSQKHVEQLRKHLHSIILPPVTLEGVTVRKAVAALEKLARQNDSWNTLIKKDFEIVISDEDTKVSYTADRPSFADALQAIAKSARLYVHVVGVGVVLNEYPANDDSVVRDYLIPPPGFDADFESSDGPDRSARETDDLLRWGGASHHGRFFYYQPSSHRLVIRGPKSDHRKWAERVTTMWKDYYAKEAKRKKKRQ
jgi:hypothetical protein